MGAMTQGFFSAERSWRYRPERPLGVEPVLLRGHDVAERAGEEWFQGIGAVAGPTGLAPAGLPQLQVGEELQRILVEKDEQDPDRDRGHWSFRIVLGHAEGHRLAGEGPCASRPSTLEEVG